MHVMHIALGGCLKAPPIQYGLTEDTGGHIAYVLGAATAQTALPQIDRVSIVTRRFDAPELGTAYAQPHEDLGPKLRICRLGTENTAYLSKEKLEAEIPRLVEAFLAHLEQADSRPDVIHAHFADAAVLARAAKRAFGIPFLYTPHSLALGKNAADRTGDTGRIERERKAIAEAAAIIVSSRDEAERQVETYGCRAGGWTHRVNPGVCQPAQVSTACAEELIAPFLRDPAKPIALAIARPVAKKNLRAVIEAFGQDKDLRDRANLVILAGLRADLSSPPEEQRAVIAELFDLVDRYDLWGSVALPRRHTQDQVAALYRLAAERGGVFVNPALHEPFGLTLIEAVQAGLPFVATNDGGPVDIAEITGGGSVVPPTAVKQIAAACRSWLDRPADDPRVTRAARRARQAFNWAAWADEVAAITEAILRPKPIEVAVPRYVLASDLDNTLTGDRTGAAAFRKWRELRQPDIEFVIATGRSIPEARRELRRWSLPEPETYITSVGTEIWRRRATGHFELCEGFARRISEGWDRTDIVTQLAPLGLKGQAIYEQRDWKLSYLGSAEDAAEVERRLRRARLAARVVFSHGCFIDVLPERAGKAAALSFEVARHGLGLEDCIACGDSGNDVDMLTQCGRAIIPANAYAEIAQLSGRGMLRSSRAYADGVLDGLRHLGFVPPVAAPVGAE